jgi:acetyltransferase-like isoleucine patch superfamily enzyme
MRNIVKSLMFGVCIVLTFPAALLSGFGRLAPVFSTFAQAYSAAPGIIGDYLRAAFYYQTLESSPAFLRISYGSFFAQAATRVGKGVYIGAYCVIGSCSLGERTQIASHVQVLSGRRQHGRDAEGAILGADEHEFQPIRVGRDCWLGAGSIVMADIGDGTTVGAGSVVVKALPARCVAVGNPARQLER